MAMVTILLLSAAAQLVSPAAVSSSHVARINLNEIIDLVKEKTAALKHDYVEDVQELADQGCKNPFFCKVESILQHHDNDNQNKADKRLVQKLGRYINNLNVNCTKELKDVPKSEVSKPFIDLLTNLNRCIKSRQFTGEGRISTSAPPRP